MEARALLLAAAVAVATAVLTAAWIALAKNLRVQDLPGRRRLHATATPRGGGIAIALAFGAALFDSTQRGPDPPAVAMLVLPFAGLAAIGWLDDVRGGLGPVAKLLGQAGCAVLAAFALWEMTPVPGVLIVAATLACLALVNAWNFMDGSNGMVALQSLLIAMAVALWPGQEAAIAAAALALAAACLGFLPFNFPRARVFLGDVGSHALGGAVFILLGWSVRLGTLGVVAAITLCTPVLLDSGLTLARRVLRGRPFWRAHREHLYQYAVRRGHSHAGVALAYAGATMLAWLLALAGRNQSMAVAVCMLGVAWLAGAFAYVALRHRWLAKTIRTKSIGTGSHG